MVHTISNFIPSILQTKCVSAYPIAVPRAQEMDPRSAYTWKCVRCLPYQSNRTSHTIMWSKNVACRRPYGHACSRQHSQSHSPHSPDMHINNESTAGWRPTNFSSFAPSHTKSLRIQSRQRMGAETMLPSFFAPICRRQGSSPLFLSCDVDLKVHMRKLKKGLGNINNERKCAWLREQCLYILDNTSTKVLGVSSSFFYFTQKTKHRPEYTLLWTPTCEIHC